MGNGYHRGSTNPQAISIILKVSSPCKTELLPAPCIMRLFLLIDPSGEEIFNTRIQQLFNSSLMVKKILVVDNEEYIGAVLSVSLMEKLG